MDTRKGTAREWPCVFHAHSELYSLTRRDFVRLGAGAAAASFAPALLSGAPLNRPIGLQLYSVRNLLPKDFDGTLRQLHEAGYREVEAAGYFNKPAAEFRHAMDQAGLRCISAHHTLTEFRSRLDELIEFAHTLGLEYLICSSSGGVHRNPNAKGEELTLDDSRSSPANSIALGQSSSPPASPSACTTTCQFAVENGVVVYDELLRLTDPEHVVSRWTADG